MAEPHSSEQSLAPLSAKDSPSPRLSQRWRRFWFGVGFLLGGSLGLSLGSVWSLHQRLSPLIARELTHFLNRPVQIGELQYFSLTALRFGESGIAPTSQDPDRVRMKALEVHYNPLTYLLNRRLNVVVTAVNPEIFLEQAGNREWLRTPLHPLDPNHPINLVQLRLRQAQATIITRSPEGTIRPAVKLIVPQAKAQFNGRNPQIRFDLIGNFASGDWLSLAGVVQFQAHHHQIQLQLQGKNLPAPSVGHLLPLPFQVRQGTIDSHLSLDWQGSQAPRWTGTTYLQGVKAEFKQLPRPLTQLNGLLRFQGDRIQFEQVNAAYGTIAGTIQGNLYPQQGFLLEAEIPETPMQSWMTTLKLPMSIPVQGSLKTRLSLTGSFARPLLMVDLKTSHPSHIDRISWRSLQAQLALQDSILAVRQLQAIPAAGGALTGMGTLDFRDKRSRYALNFQTQRWAIASLRPYRPDLPLDANLTSQGQIKGDFKQPHRLQMGASGQINLPQGAIAIDQVQIDGQHWQGLFRAKNLALASWIPKLPRTLAGNLDGQWRLAGDLSGKLRGLVGVGKGRLSLPQGLITAEQVQVAQGRWSGQFRAQDLGVQSFLPAAHNGDRLTGDFTLAGALERPQQSLTGNGSARLALNSGILTLPRIALNGEQVQATLLAQDIGLRPFSPHLRGKVSGRVEITGSLAQWQVDHIESQGNLAFSEGIGAFTRPIAADFLWNGRRLQLSKLTAPDLIAQGWVDFSLRDRNFEMLGFDLALRAQDFSLRELPLPTTIPLEQVAGQVDFEGRIAGNLERPMIDGNLVLTRGRSPLLPLPLEPVLQGQIRSQGNQRLSLNLAGKQDRIALILDSRYQLAELDLQLAQLQVKGRQQQLQFFIEAAHVPLPLLQAIAKVNPGIFQGFPTALRQNLLDPSLNGDLSGRLWLNPSANSVIGEEMVILNPRLGTLQGDRITGNFQYSNGQFTLQDTQFQVKQSHYQLSASLIPQTDGVHWQGEIAIAQGNIQDILTALHIDDLDDLKRAGKPPIYGKAAELYGRDDRTPASKSIPTGPLPALYAVGLPTTSDRLSDFSEQLMRFEKQRQQRRGAEPLPPLREMKGTLDGRLKLSFSPQSGLTTRFWLQGQNWRWGSYPTLQLLAQGSFHDGFLVFDPLNLRIGNEQSQLNFVGQIGDQSQQGQLQIVNLPLHDIARAIASASPLDLGGWLNGTIIFGGSRHNPRATGQWAIERATLNQRPLPLLQGQFAYRNSRFDFSAKTVTSWRREPLTVTGTFPLRLPTSTLVPASDRWEARLQMQDEDLRLLNIFTGQQLDWISGKGILRLEAQGRIDPNTGLFQELQGQGFTQFTQTTLASSVLPVPLTNVQGKIDFNLDRIQVENLNGRLNKGTFTLHGSLPIRRVVPQSQPLQLTFNDLSLDLQGLYQGRIKGDVQWLGSLVEPSMGGTIELFNGQILLEDPFKKAIASSQTRSLPEFANFKIILADNVLITRPPIVTLSVTGDLLLNGTIDQPKPEGTLLLKSGQVNLFASQLRLASGDNNTAQFMPKWGVDPYLNLRLVTAVSETNRKAVRSTPLSSEINDPFTANNDSLQTVRIQAQVKGLASQLARNIDLTSNPPRNRAEIITLLGGSFVNTFSSSDPTVGLANLAGNAVFGTVQGAIGDALGLSEFRIFSTPLINDKERIRSTQIGVAAEAGVDLTHDLSLSILQILNADRPPQFGIRYRLNENTILRGSSNFSDDNRGIVEYEHRF